MLPIQGSLYKKHFFVRYVSYFSSVLTQCLTLNYKILNFMTSIKLHCTQREEEAHKEAQERRKLEEELREQRGLIDALTAETMTLREEAAALQVRRSLPHGLSLVC